MSPKLACFTFVTTCFIISLSLNGIPTLGTDFSKVKFGIMIDTSSSATSVNIFAWKSSLVYPEILNNIDYLRNENGVAARLMIPQGLKDLLVNSWKEIGYVKSIIDFIWSNIPAESNKFTKIYLMGTSDLDNRTQQVLLERISLKIKEKMPISEIEVSIETEMNIGIYKWIAINSLLDRFIESAKMDPINRQTVTVVEMNHYNVQVTFHYKIGMDALIAGYLQRRPAAYKTLEHYILESNISKRGRGCYPYTLVSVLFKDLGIERARSAYIDYLIESQLKISKSYFRESDEWKRNLLIVQDPCLPNKAVEFLDKPARMLSTSKKIIGFTTLKDEEKFTLSIKGSGDYWKCKSYLKNLLRLARTDRLSCDTTDKYCSTSLIGSLFIPFEFSEAVGIIDFHDLANKLNLGGKYDRSKIVQNTKEYCTSPYKELLKKYAKPYRDEDHVVIQNCFKALWIDTFLSYALQMPDDFKRFRTIEKVGDQAFEWTLGAIVNKSVTI